MTSLFDGMPGLLSGVFGAVVTYLPKAGGSREIQSIFRESPIDITGADGQELRIDAPTWRVERNLAPELSKDDRITVADGRSFKVTVVHSNGSPGRDAFMICELHLIRGISP